MTRQDIFNQRRAEFAGQIMAGLVAGRTMQRQPLGAISEKVSSYAKSVADIATGLAAELQRRENAEAAEIN